MQNRDKEGDQLILFFQDFPSFNMETCIPEIPSVLVFKLKVLCVRDPVETGGHPRYPGQSRLAREQFEHSLRARKGI